ncbi:MAG: PAS domain-containing sensor histidine kinase [Chitinophagales bacterium]|nr:PAS domain-containing sensor histidine kinase [Chitinophagales bacterium]
MHKYDFNLLFNNKTVGILIVNSSGKIIEANSFITDQFGYNYDELINMSVDDLAPSEVAKHHSHHRNSYEKNPHARIMGAGLDLYGKKKDGSIFPIEISLSPFVKDGQSYTTAFIMDISIRKANEEKINKQNQELQLIKKELQEFNLELENKVSQRTSELEETLSKLEDSKNELKDALDKERELGELKSRFLSMASHEFRTPLSTILSSVGLIKRYIENEQVQNCERHIERIRTSVEHLNAVLEDFLSLGKIEEGQIKMNNEDFDINEEIENIVVEMRDLSRAGQTIMVFPSEKTILYTDKHLLKIAFSNLLSNAIKFSQEYSTIEVILEKESNQFLIHVKDYGIGIPLEDQKHLFMRFFRASNSSNIQGTGLGLFIVKRYIDILKGSLSFVSTPNKGTTITIALPI